MAEKWMQAQQVDKGYIVIMLTKMVMVNLVMLTKNMVMVNMVTRCCHMTSSSNWPSVKLRF